MRNLYKKYSVLAGVACALSMLGSGNVNALSCDGLSGYCLQNGNASFSIESFGGSITVDGLQHVFATDLLVANMDLTTGKGTPITNSHLAFSDYMDLDQVPTATPYSVLNLTGLDLGWATIDLTFDLQGGATGSNLATVDETFTITNTSGSALDLSMIAYTDAQLGGSGNGFADLGIFAGTYKQSSDLYQIVSSFNVAPDHYEVGIYQDCFSDLCDRVYNDPGDMLLDGSVAPGPADLEMAAQWKRNLGVGESFSYTQTMVISELGYVASVPIPAAVWLFGSGLIGLAGIARKRKAT